MLSKQNFPLASWNFFNWNSKTSSRLITFQFHINCFKHAVNLKLRLQYVRAHATDLEFQRFQHKVKSWGKLCNALIYTRCDVDAVHATGSVFMGCWWWIMTAVRGGMSAAVFFCIVFRARHQIKLRSSLCSGSIRHKFPVIQSNMYCELIQS